MLRIDFKTSLPTSLKLKMCPVKKDAHFYVKFPIFSHFNCFSSKTSQKSCKNYFEVEKIDGFYVLDPPKP